MVKRYGHRALAICLVFLRYVIPYVRLARGGLSQTNLEDISFSLNIVITGFHHVMSQIPEWRSVSGLTTAN